MALAVGEYTALDPRQDSGCVVFPANPAGSEAEFLLVPQSATGVPGTTAGFSLKGATEPVAAPPAVSGAVMAWADLPPAERFHLFLRQGEETRRWGDLVPVPGPVGAPRAGPPHPPQLVKPVVGELRTFKVCATLDCERFDDVRARAEAVGEHLAIFVDTLAPADGLTAADFDTLKTLFDTRLYPIDTAAFGSESDINDDSVVIVLMTNVVNKLVTDQQCQDQGFVAGFFLGADIDPAFQNDPRSNKAEVFYSIVADPLGELSCSHDRAQVKRFVPITFIHELQHMISYNQHVLERGNDGEALWLNEGLSHYAEELGARSFLAEGDNQGFTDYVLGNLLNGYKYLEDPGGHFLLPTEGIGTLAERGANWLYVRYIVDRYSGGTTSTEWNAFTRRLVETSRRGAANVEFVTGDPFVTSVTGWALANWLDDLPGLTAPAELTYPSWNFRSVYQQLNGTNPGSFPQPFPLVPAVSAGDLVNVSGTLRAGSGVYHRAMQAAGAPQFILTFRTSSGRLLSAGAVARLNVIRIR